MWARCYQQQESKLRPGLCFRVLLWSQAGPWRPEASAVWELHLGRQSQTQACKRPLSGHTPTPADSSNCVLQTSLRPSSEALSCSPDHISCGHTCTCPQPRVTCKDVLARAPGPPHRPAHSRRQSEELAWWPRGPAVTWGFLQTPVRTPNRTGPSSKGSFGITGTSETLTSC